MAYDKPQEGQCPWINRNLRRLPRTCARPLSLSSLPLSPFVSTGWHSNLTANGPTVPNIRMNDAASSVRPRKHVGVHPEVSQLRQLAQRFWEMLQLVCTPKRLSTAGPASSYLNKPGRRISVLGTRFGVLESNGGACQEPGDRVKWHGNSQAILTSGKKKKKWCCLNLNAAFGN